jgi:hypothetical protein
MTFSQFTWNRLIHLSYVTEIHYEWCPQCNNRDTELSRESLEYRSWWNGPCFGDRNRPVLASLSQTTQNMALAFTRIFFGAVIHFCPFSLSTFNLQGSATLTDESLRGFYFIAKWEAGTGAILQSGSKIIESILVTHALSYISFLFRERLIRTHLPDSARFINQ